MKTIVNVFILVALLIMGACTPQKKGGRKKSGGSALTGDGIVDGQNDNQSLGYPLNNIALRYSLV